MSRKTEVTDETSSEGRRLIKRTIIEEEYSDEAEGETFDGTPEAEDPEEEEEEARPSRRR